MAYAPSVTASIPTVTNVIRPTVHSASMDTSSRTTPATYVAADWLAAIFVHQLFVPLVIQDTFYKTQRVTLVLRDSQTL